MSETNTNNQFMDENNIQFMVTQIFEKTNIRIDERITNDIDKEHSEKMIPSAKVTYNKFQNLQSSINDNTTQINEIKEDLNNINLSSNVTSNIPIRLEVNESGGLRIIY